MAIAINIKNLCKDFKTNKETFHAVKNLNLSVNKGEVIGFLGPNGAGKTTTMRMLTTLLAPTSGDATIAGYDLLKQPNEVRQRIGYISQIGGLDENFTGRENLILQARLFGISKREAELRAQDLIKKLNLESYIDRFVRTYSGGQKRLVDLASGIIHKPEVLFMDEPTLGLDPKNRAHLWEQVRLLQASGTTIIITTHYLDEADALCDRLAIIDGGTIVAEGKPSALKKIVAKDVITLELLPEDQSKALDILKQEEFVKEINIVKGQLKIYVETGDHILPTVLKVLDRNTILTQAISLTHSTLDDVFLHFTGKLLKGN